MRGRPGHQAASEGEYASAARAAFDRNDLALALEQVGAALSWNPSSPEHLTLLERILERSRRPLSLLPDPGEAFFGTAAVRSWVLARERRLGSAVEALLDVVAFRPSIPYLVWCDRWTTGGVRGVSVSAVSAGVARFINRVDEEVLEGADPALNALNLEAALGLVGKLRIARPTSGAELVVLQSLLLRRLGRLDQARSLLDGARKRADARVLKLELAAVMRALDSLDDAQTLLAEAIEGKPDDVAAKLDLADVLLELGAFAEAEGTYREALALGATDVEQMHARPLLTYAAALASPGDDTRWRALEELATESPRGRAILESLDAAECALSVDDPIAQVVRSVVARTSSDGLSGPVRVRVRADTPPSASANVALRAALASNGREGELIAVIDRDGTMVEIANDPPRAIAVPPEVIARVAALARSNLDLSAWCSGEATISTNEADSLLDLVLGDSAEDPVHRLQRTRLALLSLVARRSPQAGVDASAWLSTLALGPDEWLAAAAIAVLGATAMRDGSPSAPAYGALVLAYNQAPRDTRREALARALLRLPFGDETIRRRAHRQRPVAARRRVFGVSLATDPVGGTFG